MLRSGGQACTASRSAGGCARLHGYAAARPVHWPYRLINSQRCHRTTVLAATGTCVSPVAADSPPLPVPSEPAVQQLWDRLQPKVAASGPQIYYHNRPTELNRLKDLDRKQPQLLAWHVLQQLRPYLQDVDGRLATWFITDMVAQRIDCHGDYSPLVWALGLEQPVATATSSPLPPLPDPPLDDETKSRALLFAIREINNPGSTGGVFQNLHYIRQVLQQLQQQQPGADVLDNPYIPLALWWRCKAAGQEDIFWQLLQEVPDLRWAAAYMPHELEVDEVQPIADGLMQSGLLVEWDPEDIWWLVCRLDNSLGDKDRMLQVFGTLALQAPEHPALDCLGAALLQMASNARRTRKLTYPRGEFGEPDEDR